MERIRTRFQVQRSTCSRADCNAFVSSRLAFTRTLSVLQASRPHLEEVNLLPGATAPGNSSVYKSNKSVDCLRTQHSHIPFSELTANLCITRLNSISHSITGATRIFCRGGQIKSRRCRRREGRGMGRSIPSPADQGVWGASWAPPAGSGADPRTVQMGFGIFQGQEPPLLEIIACISCLYWDIPVVNIRKCPFNQLKCLF